LENLKRKNQAEHEKLKQFSMDKIKRFEDDFKSKLQNHNDRLNDLLLNKQNSELELLRLQDTKKRADIDLENKLKAMKDQYYEESFNQAKGIMKILNNRYKTAIDSKENVLKKQDALINDIETMEAKITEDEKQISIDNANLTEDINAFRNNISVHQKDLDEVRMQLNSLESEQQRINSEIQKQKYNYKQISENGKYKIKEQLDRYKNHIEETRMKVGQQNQRNKTLEDELNVLKQKYAQVSGQQTKILESMKNQLNKNIYSTLSEYKDYGGGQKDVYPAKSSFNYGNY